MDRIDLRFQTVELLPSDEKRQIMELWNREYSMSPLNFYLKQGFTVIEDERSELATLSAVKIVWFEQEYNIE